MEIVKEKIVRYKQMQFKGIWLRRSSFKDTNFK